MITYLIIGVVWTGWLEYYTTAHLQSLNGPEWTFKERILQCALWPINFIIFIVAFLRGL